MGAVCPVPTAPESGLLGAAGNEFSCLARNPHQSKKGTLIKQCFPQRSQDARACNGRDKRSQR